MVNGINTLVARRPTATPAPLRPPITDHDDSLRLLVLFPLGSLLMAGLLVLALARMVGVPGPAPSYSSSGVDVDMQAELAALPDIERR